MPTLCVTHVSEQVLPISPVYTGRGFGGGGGERQNIKGNADALCVVIERHGSMIEIGWKQQH